MHSALINADPLPDVEHLAGLYAALFLPLRFSKIFIYAWVGSKDRRGPCSGNTCRNTLLWTHVGLTFFLYKAFLP
jgi:hypothetical protein